MESLLYTQLWLQDNQVLPPHPTANATLPVPPEPHRPKPAVPTATSVRWSWLSLTMLAPALWAAQPTPAQATLQVGDNCYPVAILQLALSDLGYRPGPVDGIFGTQTQDALIRFQSISDLEVDGVAGLGTAEALGLDTSDTSPYAPGQGCDTTDVAARVEEEAAPAETTDEPLASSRFYRVTADMLNVRSGPGTEYTIISSLMAGDRISGRASDSGWVRLGSGNWVAGAYLTEVQADEALASAVSESKAARIRVTTDALNARIWPSLNAPIVAVLQAGEEYDTTGSITEDGWVQLIGGNWVAQSHVVPVDDTTPEGSAMEVSDTSTTETETQEASTQDTEAQNGTIQAAEPQTPETSVARVSTLGSPLFVRATPNGDIVDTLANGAQVTLSGRTEAGWAQLQNGFWVAQDYLVS